MKKYLFLLLFPMTCFGSGKLTLAPAWMLKDDSIEAKLGLSIYERIAGPFAFTSWSGVGREIDHGKAQWWAYAKAGFEADLPAKLIVGLSAGMDYSFEDDDVRPHAIATISYKVW